MSWVDGEKIALELMDHLLTQCLAPRWPLVALPQGVDGTNKHFPGAPNALFLPGSTFQSCSFISRLGSL